MANKRIRIQSQAQFNTNQEQNEMRRLRLEELRREIGRGEESLAKGEARVFHSGEELAADIESEGQKVLGEKLASMKWINSNYCGNVFSNWKMNWQTTDKT